MVEHTLEVYYARFGVLVRPYTPKLGFNYNRVYHSKDAVVEDFALNGWKLVKKEGMVLSNTLGNELFTFSKDL